MFGSSPPGLWNVTLFGDASLYRGSQTKMRPCGWALIQYNWCPYKKTRWGHRHAQRKDEVKRHRPSRPQKKPALRHPDLELQPPELRDNTVLLFKSLSLSYFVMATRAA